MVSEETYDPQKHCCRHWYKDYCDCFKAYMKEARKTARDKNVLGTLFFLDKHKIEYVDSKVQNIVIINPTTDNVFLTLKRDYGLLRCRYNKSNKWYTFSKKTFLARFAKQ